MNKEVKTKWCGALRGDEFTQVTGSLKTDEGNCCLGVLCHLFDSEGWRKDKKGRFHFKNSRGILPKEVVKWAGLSSTDPTVGGSYFTKLNDYDGKSFKQIADLIEKYL